MRASTYSSPTRIASRATVWSALEEIRAASKPLAEEGEYVDRGRRSCVGQWRREGGASGFHAAYALGPQFTELATYAAAGNIAIGDTAAADKILLAAYGTTVVDNDVLPSHITALRIGRA